ncbi:AAA family ATPase [Pelagibius sp.]|uniref:AAA family ATPase n=1 Tax=Pelagibius sp. TaxID=1931238 RepID=UPI003B50F1D6
MNEHALLLRILRAAMTETEPGTPRAAGIVSWCRQNAETLGLGRFARKLDEAEERRSASAKSKSTKTKRTGSKAQTDPWRLLDKALSEVESAAAQVQGGKTTAVLQIAARLGKVLNLTGEETRLLQIVVAINRLRCVASLHWRLRSHGLDSTTFAAKLAGFETPEALRRSAVVELALVELSLNRGGEVTLDLSDAVDRVIDRAPAGDDDLIECLVGRSAPAELGILDFPEVLQHAELLRRLLSGAVAGKAKGVNILLYGPPGTGKTELAKTLAKAAGARLYAVGETDEYGDEPNRWERVTALALAQRVLAGRGDTLLLFDEMEDLIGDTQRSDSGRFVRRSGSKVFVNRLFENNPVPTLWTTNDIENIDAAFLRRMSYVVKMDRPRLQARKRILTRVLADEALLLEEDVIERLAATAPEVSAVARKAARSARLASGGSEEVEQTLTALVEGLRYGRRPAPGAQAEQALDLSLYHADRNVARLFSQLSAKGAARDFSLLLTGRPGTGKTALALHLAQKLDQPLVIKRASDLLSKWIGDSEKHIADAFAEAADEGSILLFDEIESLLFDRSAALRSWEVSQVNELLTWMERHPQPFIAATNHADKLDPAAMRRFVFKVTLKALTAPQREKAFRLFFGLKAPRRLQQIDGLTPGDFAVVARQLKFRADPAPAVEIAALLAAEAAAKTGGRPPIGFRPPARSAGTAEPRERRLKDAPLRDC